MEETMKIRMAIVAASTGTLALALIATTATSEERRVIGFEKTFLGGDASMRKAKTGNNTSRQITDNESPRPQDRATVKSGNSNTSDRMGGAGGGRGATRGIVPTVEPHITR
jgi:hypothetical protein